MFHVKHPLSLEDLIHFLNTQNIDVSNSQIDMLGEYHSLLLSWSHRQNLFSARDRNYLIERHFVPSFYFYQLIKNFSEKIIVDIGSGAGFPGLILQIMIPEISVTLIDSSRKKCLFLQEVNHVLNLKARVRNIRLENLTIDDQSRFNIAVARFFGNLISLWYGVAPVLKPSGVLMVQKGGTQQISVPENADHIKYWRAGISWINVSPTLSTKLIIEVKKHND